MDLTGHKLHGTHHFIAPTLEEVSAQEVDWDGSLPSTTHKIHLANVSQAMGRDIYAHIEVRVTGRKIRTHHVQQEDVPSYTVKGMAVSYRFTGVDSSETWHQGVLVA